MCQCLILVQATKVVTLMEIILGDAHINVALLPNFSCLTTPVFKILAGVNS